MPIIHLGQMEDIPKALLVKLYVGVMLELTRGNAI